LLAKKSNPTKRLQPGRIRKPMLKSGVVANEYSIVRIAVITKSQPPIFSLSHPIIKRRRISVPGSDIFKKRSISNSSAVTSRRNAKISNTSSVPRKRGARYRKDAVFFIVTIADYYLLLIIV